MINTETQVKTSRVFLSKAVSLEDSNRTYMLNSTYVLSINDSFQISFFDLDENGQLDIIVMTTCNSTYNVVGFYNNYIYDAFFLKSVTLAKKEIFYTNEIGTNYRYITTNLDGSRRLDVSYQVQQTGSQYLNLPYAYIGIGRSNNYIENFHVISNSFIIGEDNYKIFTPIIPNSQLIISKVFDQTSNPGTL
jgi:integrin alpha FG-GAP repeat containing protein 1